MSWALRFLGVGNSAAVELGSASAVIERDDAAAADDRLRPGSADRLPRTVRRATARAVHHPRAHGPRRRLERLFYATYFSELRGKVRLYVPAPLVTYLHGRLADYPGVIAEGGANWWDGFQLVPVTRGFWHEGVWFDVFPVRHHLPEPPSACAWPARWCGPATRGRSGDAGAARRRGELVAHDCALQGNPSHSGIEDLEREYPRELLSRCLFYHYGGDDAAAMRARAHRVADAGEVVALAEPTGPRMPA
jgi:hypothetical protein